MDLCPGNPTLNSTGPVYSMNSYSVHCYIMLIIFVSSMAVMVIYWLVTKQQRDRIIIQRIQFTMQRDSSAKPSVKKNWKVKQPDIRLR